MANSYVDYVGDGVVQNYSLTFPYIDIVHITVTVNGASAPFTWVNSTTIRVTTLPAAADAVRLRRTTPALVPIIDFTNGSIVTEEQLDSNAKQGLYIAQESQDVTTDNMGKAAVSLQWDAESLRVTNVADPTLAQDAATKNWVETVAAFGVIGPEGPAAWGTPAAWLTATSYTATAPRSVVTILGSTYVCLVAHTSGVFATDLAAAKWVLVASAAVGATSPMTLNTTTVTENTTIAAGTNAVSAGPITINSGIAVTITAGQRWVVL